MDRKLSKINLIFFIAVIALILINIVIYLIYKDVKTYSDEVKNDSKIKIVIDPGHGGG